MCSIFLWFFPLQDTYAVGTLATYVHMQWSYDTRAGKSFPQQKKLSPSRRRTSSKPFVVRFRTIYQPSWLSHFCALQMVHNPFLNTKVIKCTTLYRFQVRHSDKYKKTGGIKRSNVVTHPLAKRFAGLLKDVKMLVFLTTLAVCRK